VEALGATTADVAARLKELPVRLPATNVVDAKACMDRLRAAGITCHLDLE
jgi:hypothetical protein